jgi:hypothetical protein
MENLKEISAKIDTAIERVIEGFASQYIEFTDDNDNNWTIRISDHKANPLRTDENTISLVVLVSEADINESEQYDNWGVAKKEFHGISNQYFLDENGSFEENFCNTLEMLEYHLD